MGYKKTSLCQLSGRSCFGCCGDDLGSKEEMEKALVQNGKELKSYRRLSEYRDRAEADDTHPCGICRNIIREGSKILCPLHPKRNAGVDLRKGHCDIAHLCKTAEVFDSWAIEKQERYIKFINAKDPDWYDYSVKTDNGKFLEEFEAEEDGKD